MNDRANAADAAPPGVRARGWRLAALLLLGPLLALFVLDRGLVGWDAQWRWAAERIPPQTLDTYRVEAILRTIPRGSVLILGNSTAEDAFDTDLLEEAYAHRGLHFAKLTIGGSPAVNFGMLARAIDEVDPAAVILMTTTSGTGDESWKDKVVVYDVWRAMDLFTPAEILSDLGLHASGVIKQSHVLARHHYALQLTALNAMGRYPFWRLQFRIARAQFLRYMKPRLVPVEDQVAGGNDDGAEEPSPYAKPFVYPNPNSRAIELLARDAARRGTPFILVESPLLPILAGTRIAERSVDFGTYVKEISDVYDIDFIPRGELPPFVREDFKDQVHLGESGQLKFTERFIELTRERI